MPEDIYGRDSSLPDLTASQPTVGPLYENPTYTNLSPRVGLGVGRLRRRQDVRARRLRPLLQHHQPAEPDRHGHQPAGHAAAGHRQPDVPDAGLQPRRRDLDAAGAVRSRQSAHPRLQRQRAARALVAHGADGRLRRIARPPPAAQRRRQHGPAGRPGRRHGVHPRRHAAPEHELLDHRAQEQRRRVLVQRAHRRRPAPPGRRRLACSRRTRSRRAKTRRRRRRSSPTPPTARRRRCPSTSPATTRARPTSTRGTTGC